jgi:hypothetical protein
MPSDPKDQMKYDPIAPWLKDVVNKEDAKEELKPEEVIQVKVEAPAPVVEAPKPAEVVPAPAVPVEPAKVEPAPAVPTAQVPATPAVPEAPAK